MTTKSKLPDATGLIKAAAEWQNTPEHWEWVIKDRLWHRARSKGLYHKMKWENFRQHIIDALDEFEKARTDGGTLHG